MFYAFFDGDNIGPTIEILLTENRIDEAMRLSENIKIALFEIEQILKSSNDVKIIVLGGDDILIQFNPMQYDLEFLENIRGIFKEKTGISMSCGVGKDVPQSIWNLHMAKLYGKDIIKGWE